MFRLLIAAAAVAVGAWALLRRKGLVPPLIGARRQNKTETSIVIGLVHGQLKIVRQPETLTPRKGHATKLTWHVRNDTNEPREITLHNFRNRHNPGTPKPVRTDPLTRTVQAGVTLPIVNDLVDNPVVAIYKYDVRLTGGEELDPDVVIWEEGGG